MKDKEDDAVKVLILNGSAKSKGNTGSALEEAGRILEKAGIRSRSREARRNHGFCGCAE